MGGLDFRNYIGALGAVFLAALLIASNTGCASYSTGRYHSLAKGENLYQLSRRYGVPVSELVKANGIRDVSSIQVGEQIWIPRGGSQVASRSSSHKNTSKTRRAAQRDARNSGDLTFGWPVKGARLSSGFGRRSGRPHEGIDLAIGKGTTIRASESGKVVHSGWLGDYGKVVIIKHAGYYRTVYAHASRIYVSRGEFVDRGQKIALVGSTGRSTGPHLHFEIRKGEKPMNPASYLP
ncbi:MAG: peptidoglycan DD-metalloendopeptidase family protein [Myxococcota bacterium]|nr:peptidoglycan DD-metalloendopeptidase family protein [Myxococcota bacterium]